MQKHYIEETGVNCMHACFGFLEWYESASSKQPIISPLLMVPIYVERQYKRQQSVFLLNSTGDEIRDNPALNERLQKDFGLRLPCIHEAVTVQAYFSELKKIIKDQSRWRIQQRLTIGRVSFAKILMYYDLDPNTWPIDDPIFDQPLVQDLFVGPETVQPAGFAVDEHLDETDQASPVPLIISDLDSSQLSAVADAMTGKSFVIEGPPGTGKSQTITNIIAAAMAEGKSVLFVAEKQVALQVVRNRLDAAGLGDFCLELHATKVQKGKFYEELKARLELRNEGSYKLTKKLAMMIDDHRELKHQLNLYASTMGMSLGVSDRTLHDYYWMYHERKDKLPLEFIEGVESIYLKNAFRVTEAELFKYKECANQWISLIQEIHKEFGEIKSHPWYGFQSKFNGGFELKEIVQRINQLKNSLSSLKDCVSWLEAHMRGLNICSLSDLNKIVEQLQTLFDCLTDPKIYDSELFIRIRDQKDVDFLLNFSQQKHYINVLVDDLRGFLEISGMLSDKGLQELIDRLNELWNEASQAGFEEWTSFQIDAVLQTGQLNELPADFAANTFSNSLNAFQEIQQKWQTCEKKCRAYIPPESTLNPELINSLKGLQELTRKGGFELVHYSKWQELSEIIRTVFENEGEVVGSDFEEILESLPQYLIKQKNTENELKRYIALQNAPPGDFTQKLEAFTSIVQTLNNTQVTLFDLDFLCSEKAALREDKQRYKEAHLDIIHFILPDWNGQLPIKTLKNLCEAYRYLLNTPRDVLRIRTPATCDEMNYNNLQDALNKYYALRKKRLDLESRINLDIDISLLKKSISALKHSGMFSWFKKDVRDAKKVFREYCVGDMNCTKHVVLALFEQVLNYKNEYDQFYQDPRFSVFIHELSKIGDSRLEWFSSVILWSAKINQLLRGSDAILVSVKEFIFHSSLDQLDSFMQTFENIDLLKCLEDLSIHSQYPFIDDQIKNLKQEEEKLDRLRVAAIEVGYHRDVLFKRAEEVYELYCIFVDNQEKIKFSTHTLIERSKVLKEAIDLCGQIGVMNPAESLFIADIIKVLEEYEVLKEASKKQEDILASKKYQMQRIYELCSRTVLCANIPFIEISKIVEKLQVLRQAVADIPLSTIFDCTDSIPLNDIHDACQLYSQLTSKAISDQLIKYVQDKSLESRIAELENLLSRLKLMLPQAVDELESVIKDGEVSTKVWFGKGDVLKCSLVAIIEKLEKVYGMRDHLQGWALLRNLEDKLALYGIKSLAELLLRIKIEPVLIPIAIEFVLYQSIIVSTQREYPMVNQVECHDIDSLRNRFAEIDKQLIGLYRKYAAAKIMERAVDPGTKRGSRREWTGKALIELEVSKQRKHRPIRELLLNAGEAMQSIKPCFMMSPLSVVQYLAPGNLTFDLIIIDEASQVKPEDAIGTFARGKQVIVVGDPKQLPPTDFWKKGGDFEEDEDENEDIGNEESILDLAATIYQPMRRLRWHYRSQHESLINYSNHEFYDNNLIIFPSPSFADSTLGISYHFVEDAQYLRGGDKINHEEASQLVNAVEISMRDHPDRSIGIVTMNVPQRELINELINARFSESTAMEEFRAKWSGTLEEFFVKNLENVQGDERDVIFISTLYGKEKLSVSEKLNQNFGPINKANGHRRLNVLFTRAKQKIVIFTSLDPDEIRVTEESPRGLRVFKEYLKFAKTGNLSYNRVIGRDFGSDFERSVAKYIKDWGYEVDSQVGVGEYFLDLAVIHPHKPGKHMLAIECDGATYHSSRSARDRDRLRQQALERMGWAIHRIWSTDWFRNQRDELKQLKAILQLKAEEL